MGGGDVHHERGFCLSWQRMDLQPIDIDGNRHKLRAVCVQHLPRRGIARLLKANAVSRLESCQRQ
jgi:hypothetical protein